jgi:hypothetical protein
VLVGSAVCGTANWRGELAALRAGSSPPFPTAAPPTHLTAKTITIGVSVLTAVRWLWLRTLETVDKPFYMFTGRDGKTPLPSFARTAKATSRVKFDRNKNVEADLAFWSSSLKGTETINIGGGHVDDLLQEAAFLTVEVPEIGVIEDEPQRQDRMPA